MAKQITCDKNASPRRRWLNIGPGIVLALAISALIASQWIKTESAARRQTGGPPIVERQVVTSSYEEKLGPTPELGFIIDRAAKLHITQSQLIRLNALREKWEHFYGPKMQAANKAAAKTNDYLARAQDRSRTPVSQIQDAAAPLIALSGEISAARRSYWDQALKILTPEQRKGLDAERQADWAARQASARRGSPDPAGR